MINYLDDTLKVRQKVFDLSDKLYMLTLEFKSESSWSASDNMADIKKDAVSIYKIIDDMNVQLTRDIHTQLAIDEYGNIPDEIIHDTNDDPF